MSSGLLPPYAYKGNLRTCPDSIDDNTADPYVAPCSEPVTVPSVAVMVPSVVFSLKGVTEPTWSSKKERMADQESASAWGFEPYVS